MTRPPLDLAGRRTPGSDEIEIARQIVRRAGVLKVLTPHLDSEVGRHRRLPLEAFLIACQLNALQRNHQGHLIDVARLLNAMTTEQRAALGIEQWSEEHAYERVIFLFHKLWRLLSSGIAGIDPTWFANALARGSVPQRYRQSAVVAVDGTDLETWGAFQGSERSIEYDGEAKETQIVPPGPDVSRKRRAKVLGVGPDGRKVYTPDPDARAGHRSANGQHQAGPYLGYELHIAVQARALRWTDYVERVSFAPEVPNVITNLSLTPAGSHRANAIVPLLVASKRAGQSIEEVIWDPGYSLCTPETTIYPLQQSGIEQTFQLVMAQRGIRPFSKEAIIVDGQLYSTHLPPELRDLALAPMRSTGNYRLAYEEPFNRRARWRLVRHSTPDRDGVTRWKCPFCAGLLRSRSFPRTMRGSRCAPLVFLPATTERCCAGTVSAPPADLPHVQRIPFGTTAWRKSMNRRMAVESVNAALKGGFVNMTRGFFRVFGLAKLTILLGFTVAAVNLDRIRSYEAKLADEAVQPLRRRPRRVGTWASLIAELGDEKLSTAAPPG